MNMLNAIAAHHGVLANAGGGGGVARGDYALVGSGTQYIDTGAIFEDAGRLVTTVKNVSGSTYFLGNTGTVNGGIVFFGSSGGIYLVYGVNDGLGGMSIGEPSDYFKLEVNHDKTYYFDDVYKATATSSVTLARNMILFGHNGFSTPTATPTPRHINMSTYMQYDASESLQVDMWAVPQGMKALGASASTTSDIGTVIIDGIATTSCMYNATDDQYKENRGTGAFNFEAL